MTAKSDEAQDAPSSFEIEPTVIMDETSTEASTGSESPMTTKSTDSLEKAPSSNQNTIRVPVQRITSKTKLHQAGSSMPLISQKEAERLSVKQPNAYCYNSPANTWHLRIGPDYNSKRRKAPSGEAFMDLVGMDFLHTPQGRLDDIGKYVEIPSEWKSLNTSSSSNPKIPPIFIVNVQGAEAYKHTMFGYPMDVPGTAFVFYFKMKQETMDAISNLSRAPPALRLFADYLANGAEAYAEMMRRREADNNPTGIYDNKYFGKFKVCLRCDNIKDPSMSWIPSVAVAYNEKPTVITYSGTLLRGPGYVEMDVDTRQFGILAGHTIPLLMRNLHQAINSVAFCIESVEENEMPERAFGVATMHKFKCTEDLPVINVAAATKKTKK